MRTSDVFLSFILLSAASSDATPKAPRDGVEFAPFLSPIRQTRPLLLFKRQSCPADHTSCSNIGAGEACCPTGTNCARDSRNNVACCPANNYCTGVIGQTQSSGGSTTQPSPGTSSGTGGFVGTVTVTSTAGVTASGQTGAPTITGSVAGGGSTVPNAYYPFVYLPTSFGNSAICSQYYTSCQSASTACFQSLGGINGVTIGGMTGGTTQVGMTGIVQASASSICSSLSQSACYGLQSTQCAQFGSTGATGTNLVQLGKGPRETGGAALAYVAAAGLAVGAVGMAL